MAFLRAPAFFLLALTLVIGADGAGLKYGKANPIRKVVAMIEKMAKKVEEEGKVEDELFEKFECYCTKTQKELTDMVNKATQNPITQADIDGKIAELKAAKQDVEDLKKSKADSEDDLAKAVTLRKQENKVYKKEVTTGKETVTAADSAIGALKAKNIGSFLQSERSRYVPVLLKAIANSEALGPVTKHKISFFLQGKRQDQEPSTGQAIGILKTLKTGTEGEIKTVTKQETTSVEINQEIKKTKAEQIAEALQQMEDKMTKVGAIEVQIVNMKNDMKDGAAALEENKKTLAALKTQCQDKAKEREVRNKLRGEEQLALQDVIKMLTSDDALEIFKKAIKPPSLLQITTGHEVARNKAKSIISSRRPNNHHRSLAWS